MPEPTNAARELAATGTPGPFRAGTTGPHGGDHWFVASRTTGDVVCHIRSDDGDNEDARAPDAIKITRAVNALGPLGDAFEDMARTHFQTPFSSWSSRHMLAEHAEGSPLCDEGCLDHFEICNGCGTTECHEWPRWRPVEAALRGEQP